VGRGDGSSQRARRPRADPLLATWAFSGRRLSNGAPDGGNAAAPHGLAETWTEKDGPALRLHLGPIPAATAYGLVRGEVRNLRRFAGGYTAMQRNCLASDYAGTPVTDAELLFSGEGRWYLVRPVNCGGAGS